MLHTKVTGAIELRVTYAAENGLALTAPGPIQANTIIQVELAARGERLRVWVRVARYERVAEEHQLEVQPFALGRKDQERWDALVGTGLDGQRHGPKEDQSEPQGEAAPEKLRARQTSPRLRSMGRA